MLASLWSPRQHLLYAIDANGMVTATATDKISGQTKTVSVDYKKGIKPKAKPASAYPVLMRTAAEALQKLARDPRYVGGRIGILAVLHTWSRTLE